MTLDEILDNIEPLNLEAMEQARRKWNSIAKPLHSLGKLEEHVIRIAGIRGEADVHLEKKALLVMCADNGVVEEGVAQTGQEVTAIVAENFLAGNTSASIMCRKAGVELFPIDIGMSAKTRVPDHKIAYGTKNMAKGPAMTRDEAIQAMMVGIELVREKKEEGFEILATGEMGIGNTTTSSAVSTLLLGEMPERMTGRGAGLTSEGLEHKIRVIKRAICRNRPVAADTLDVLSKVGGFDIAGLAGVFLGGAYYRIPVVIDGFISATAALAAYKLCPLAREYMLASHISGEPGMKLILDELGMEAVLAADMRLGEGTGALSYIPVLDMAAEVYQKMSTFSENHIEDYKELDDR